jgi:hypothetical protein
MPGLDGLVNWKQKVLEASGKSFAHLCKSLARIWSIWSSGSDKENSFSHLCAVGGRLNHAREKLPLLFLGA